MKLYGKAKGLGADDDVLSDEFAVRGFIEACEVLRGEEFCPD